ncbi:MAG: thiamine phosphate synthase [Muribaculaceae bacterium]|nr:thiamine phosphate synthase [Muribaculaceae bacterium]
MVKIAFTPHRPSSSPLKEAGVITNLLEDEVDFVHLRHPDADTDLLRSILEEIRPDLRQRITLHDHYDLAFLHLAGGIQLNSRNGITDVMVHKDSEIRISKSCHTIEEIMEAGESGRLAYATLSPIFDSISKAGYSSNFNSDELSEFLGDCRLPVIALGGVTPEKLPMINELGFAGAAMLGHYMPLFEHA